MIGLSWWFEFSRDAFPIFLEWFRWIVDMKDKEWEDISKAWPAPTRTQVAKLRYEARKRAIFFKEENSGG